MTLQITRMRIGRSAGKATAQDATVDFDRPLVMASLFLALLLVWPLIVFGRAAYYEDTVSYYKGGEAAFSFATHKLATAGSSATHSAAAVGAIPMAAIGGPPTALIAETKGARSVSYSVLTAAFAGPSAKLIPLAMLQALLLAFCATVMLRVADIGPRLFGLTAVILAVATPAAWFVCFASPDIFAGMTILVFTILTIFGERLTGRITLALVLIGAFAVTAHSSNLALAIAMLVTGLVGSRRLRARALGNRKLLLLTLAPVVLGVVIVVIGGVVGFGEVSVAPKRYPLTLARSINGGAARPYLREACPTHHYVVCDLYGDQLGNDSGEFLWGTDGVANRATSAQMEQLRAEEWQIVTRATLRYPWLELRQATLGTFEQLAAFQLKGVGFDQRLSVDGQVALIPDPRASLDLGRPLDTLIVAMVLAALAALAAFYRRMSSNQRRVVHYIVSGIVLNAAICAFFSAVADRYGARVIWLLPLAVAVATCQPRSRPPGKRA